MIRHHAVAAAAAALQPLGDWHGWVTVKDYPVEAVLAAQEGATAFALSIDANGLPQDCRITKSSGSKILDDQTCAVMLIRARFRPPVDKRGQPIASATYRQSIRWHLPPQTKAEQVVDRSFDAVATIGPNGVVTGCQLTGAGASRLAQDKDKGNCGLFGQRNFLSFFLKDNYARTRATNVRLSITFDGNAPPQLDRPPSFYVVLAKAALDVGTDGRMAACTSVQPMTVAGRNTDLCEFLKSDPPHYPPQPQPRKATILLDLSADYQ